MRNAWLLLSAIVLAVIPACQVLQRKALFYPTHREGDGGLVRWAHDGAAIGFARQVANPENIWLLLHGNGGQAADRVYALGAFSTRDSVFIMEYPGYGARAGKPSRRGFDAAALEAYDLLRASFPGKPVCVAAESIGSGPAATLARAPVVPDKLVFIVPFDNLKSVARDHVRYLPVGLLLAGSWDNVASLAQYDGPMEVFGAERDEVIPVRHARALAASRPQAQFHLIPGGHNEWSRAGAVRIRNP
jgi:pimeloyl-ACP methyl ester carboxylesterase